ncbi:glycerophosphoryl diester phosphodiesterase membrane domain-containing protein [Sphingorhabdus sp. EL138]|uniref:glycerophosphoryl diester phosphodiesterase membrane domain-containing protein n=1 Tax=Sphingorhabdus sp. EL138 TaxID=2073156 RepID=UPI0013A5656F|nr:glycerophosphoryl diester phosphodiesterase membrane domain-containing protein [Sphingorhabdus sp. EL138]
MAQFVGQPNLEGTEDLNAITAAYSTFFSENAFAIIASNLLISFGGFVIYFTIAPSHSGTVADDLGKALRLFLIFLIANILTGLATFAGILLFIIPGLYVACRLILVPIIIADLSERNPLEALKKSWESTKDNGFSILLLVLMIAVIGAITVGVIQMIIGVIIGLATGGAGWPLIENLVSALGGSALQILFTVLIGSIYYQLTGKGSDVGEVFT